VLAGIGKESCSIARVLPGELRLAEDGLPMRVRRRVVVLL